MDVKQKLMTHPHPSVRVCALMTLDERPADDPRVVESRMRIPHVPPVSDILAAQYPAGYWMHAGLGISPRYRATVWQVLFLAQFGVGPIPEVVRAIASLCRDNLDDVGAFHLRRGTGGRSLALTGALLWAVARLGCQPTADWSASWQWVRERLESGPVAPAGRVWVARAVAAWQGAGGLGHRAIHQVIDWPDRLRTPAALTFPVVLEPDLLTLMTACVEAGAPERISPTAVDWLRGRRLPSGEWPLEHVPGRLWCFPGKVGRPNPWVTVQALSILQCIR